MSLLERVKLTITEEKNDADDTRSKAQKFTDKINKAREERRKLKTGTDGKRARRVINATGEKKKGSFSKGNLSFPGDRSGAYQATKSDIEARKGFKDVKPGGLKADEKNPYVKREVRRGRVKDLGGDIFDQPKFSQKEFDKSIGGSKKPTDAAAPGDFGKPKTKKTFKNFRQDQGFNAKKKAIQDIRASDKRLYDAGVGKKPSLVQQRKFAKDAFKKAQQKQQAEFNRQQRLSRMYSPFDDGDVGNPDASKSSKSTPKKVKASSGAKVEFPSGSPEMGGESKKFASRKRTPAPQIKSVKKSKTPPPLNKSTAKLDTKTSGGLRITQNLTPRDSNKSTKAFTRKSVVDKISRMDRSQQQNLIKNNPGAAGRIQSTLSKTGNQEVPKLSRTVTQGIGKGATSKVTGNKDFATFMKNNKINNTSIGKKKVDLPKFGKNSGVTNPSFMKKVTPKVRKSLKPAAKIFNKLGPFGKLVTAGIIGYGIVKGTQAGLDYAGKKIQGAGKKKGIPSVIGSPLRYTTGSKKGQRKFFDISTMKRKTFKPSDFRDMDKTSKTYGQVDAGFNDKADQNLQKRIRNAANKK